MKKLILNILAMVLMVGAVHANGIISSNISSGTSVLATARKQVYQISVASSTANLLNFYDSATNSLTYVIGTYLRSTNITLSVTNLTTNGIFVYDTSTQYLIQTNIYVGGNFRTNVTVPQTTNQYPVASTLYIPAGTVVTLDSIDANFVNGISVTATNSATVIIYTRD